MYNHPRKTVITQQFLRCYSHFPNSGFLELRARMAFRQASDTLGDKPSLAVKEETYCLFSEYNPVSSRTAFARNELVEST